MVYCTSNDVYRQAGITSSDVAAADIDEWIFEATEYLDAYFNTTFETKQLSQVKDGNGTNYMYTDFYPLVSVDTLTIDGTSITTTELYIYNGTGRIVLKDSAEVGVFKWTQPQQVAITFTYGYDLDFTTITNNQNFNRIAYVIRSLCSKIAAIQALTNQIGGTFDDVTSYQLPELSASKGEPFTNIRETIVRLQNEINKQMNDPAIQAIAKSVNFA